MSSAWRRRPKAFALALLLACVAAEAATAQFYFQPFFHTWRYDLPPDAEDAPRYASRRAVARILARAGHELVGPLGRRGDQIVATGVNARGSETRFFIDPFEGEIIHALRLGPSTAAERTWREDGSPVGEGALRETPLRERSRATAAPIEPRRPVPETTSPHAPQTGAAAELDAKQEEKPVTAPKAARSTGSSHRAIVPPKPAEGTTAATPSQSTGDAKTPPSVAMPKVAQ